MRTEVTCFYFKTFLVVLRTIRNPVIMIDSNLGPQNKDVSTFSKIRECE
jgi:hypothetical protein